MDATGLAIAGQATMALLLPGLLWLLLMRVPGFGQAVRRVRRWQHARDVLDYIETQEGGDDNG